MSRPARSEVRARTGRLVGAGAAARRRALIAAAHAPRATAAIQLLRPNSVSLNWKRRDEVNIYTLVFYGEQVVQFPLIPLFVSPLRLALMENYESGLEVSRLYIV